MLGEGVCGGPYSEAITLKPGESGSYLTEPWTWQPGSWS